MALSFPKGPGCIQRIDQQGTVETLYDTWDGQALQSPNDLVMDAHGGFYSFSFSILFHRGDCVTYNRISVCANGSIITQQDVPHRCLCGPACADNYNN